MNAQVKDRALADKIAPVVPKAITNVEGLGDAIGCGQFIHMARTLRRAQLTLHRWAEEECNGTIQRMGENADGAPMRVSEWMNGQRRGYYPVPDREAGALRRVGQVCKAAGLHYYHQTDPRGCALYVSTEPLTDQNYSSKGIPCL